MYLCESCTSLKNLFLGASDVLCILIALSTSKMLFYMHGTFRKFYEQSPKSLMRPKQGEEAIRKVKKPVHKFETLYTGQKKKIEKAFQDSLSPTTAGCSLKSCECLMKSFWMSILSFILWFLCIGKTLSVSPECLSPVLSVNKSVSLS